MRILRSIITTNLLLGFLLVGCENGNENINTSQETKVYFSATQYSDRTDLQSDIEELAYDLSQNRNWFNATLIENSNESGVLLTDFPNYSSIENVILDSVEYEIKIEFFNENKLEDLLDDLDNLDYGVMIDPDFFYANDDTLDGFDVTTYYSNSTSSSSIYLPNVTLDEEDSTSVDSVVSNISKPIFIVALEQVEDSVETARIWDELFGEEGLTKPNGNTPYLALKQIKLYKKKDWSNEEFELYFTTTSDPTSHTSGAYSSTNPKTIHKFRGKTQKDAAGNYVYYKDVNKKNSYTHSEDIAICKLGTTSHGYVQAKILGIEDDFYQGIHHRNSWSVLPPYNVSYKNITHYRATTNSKMSSTWVLGVEPSWYSDNDDIYERSGADYLNIYSLEAQKDPSSGYVNTDKAGKLGHVRWLLKVKNY